MPDPSDMFVIPRMSLRPSNEMLLPTPRLEFVLKSKSQGGAWIFHSPVNRAQRKFLVDLTAQGEVSVSTAILDHKRGLLVSKIDASEWPYFV